MRKIVHMINTSLDGRIAGPKGEFDWTDMGPQLSARGAELHERCEALLYGRPVWEWMSAYWPRAEELSDHPHDRAYAPVWRAAPKIVASRTLDAVDFPNTTLVRSLDEIAALKDQPGGDLLLMGGARLAAALADAGLLDEVHVVVFPVVLGGDNAVLPTDTRLGLTLVSSEVCDGTVVRSVYTRP